ncbi:MAG: O-sialoglycoprotein endopeptidase [Eubacterium sp.]|nr:O-sialoglycoprotein endopeptidase [Eubacterium sp.]
MKFALGIDTSNYKTSIALTDEDGNIIFDDRILLTVKNGKRGLRQQEALFQHINNLPILFNKMLKNIDGRNIVVVSVSDRPRSVEGSYMPTFLAGVSQAKIISSMLACPLYTFSHQEGHIRAASKYTALSNSDKYICFHFSGGTTEALLYDKHKLKIIGGSKDISFGQLIDRIGVVLGFDFPCGDKLDSLAYEYVNTKKLPVSIEYPKVKSMRGYINLSGIETSIIRQIEASNLESEEVKLLAIKLFIRIKEAITSIIKDLSDEYNIYDFLFAGGVSSSRTLRNLIETDKGEQKYFFCDADKASDNAIGISLLGGEKIWQ